MSSIIGKAERSNKRCRAGQPGKDIMATQATKMTQGTVKKQRMEIPREETESEINEVEECDAKGVECDPNEEGDSGDVEDISFFRW